MICPACGQDAWQLEEEGVCRECVQHPTTTESAWRCVHCGASLDSTDTMLLGHRQHGTCTICGVPQSRRVVLL